MDGGQAIDVARRVVGLLDDGSFTATYKHAVLLAIIDLIAEGCDRHGAPPSVLTTRQLAERVTELYWPQVRQWNGAVLEQGRSGHRLPSGTAIGRSVLDFQRQAAERLGAQPALSRARSSDPDKWACLVDEIEWILVHMPLPKLQRIGPTEDRFLFELGFGDDKTRDLAAPTRGAIRRYQRALAQGETVDLGFDNTLRFKPGVPEALLAAGDLLRPLVQHRWAQKVADLNHVESDRLRQFLFGVDRVALAEVREPLAEIQSGRCFYCQRDVRARVHVDHFLPWARQPEDGLANLVYAHEACNLSKSDLLADAEHVARWRDRNERHREALESIEHHLEWSVDASRVLGAARGLYFSLPERTPLWVARRAPPRLLDERARSAIEVALS